MAKSPIPENKLRCPAQTLREKRNRHFILTGGILLGGSFIIFGLLLGFFIGRLNGNGYGIWYWILIIFSSGFIFWGIFWEKKQFRLLKQLDLGIDGEIFVGRLLEDLSIGHPWKVLHDFQTGRGNIDHIIIAPQGVFTVETKTVSIHEEEQNIIHYDCENIWTSNRKLDSPLKQARAEASFMENYLRRKLTLNVSVQPIVTYPGWDYRYCGRKKLAECPVWVCQTKGIAAVIHRRDPVLTQEEILRIYHFLASENHA